MSAPMWFAHRLNDWSKLAKERVKRATGDGDQDSTTNLSTSSDDGSTQKDSQMSANSSFEVRWRFCDIFCCRLQDSLFVIPGIHEEQLAAISVGSAASKQIVSTATPPKNVEHLERKQRRKFTSGETSAGERKRD